ncbi:MAG: cytochrome C oxidase subunit IV family protein [Thermogutta sp.]
MNTANSQHQEGFGHVVPLGTLLAVFAALIVLTVITVAATWVDLGSANLFLAMGIAAIKATLVALYFMHLRYDHPFNALVFVVGLLFLTLFLGLTLLDTKQYSPEIQAAVETPV